MYIVGQTPSIESLLEPLFLLQTIVHVSGMQSEASCAFGA